MNGVEIRIDIVPEKRREFLLTVEDLLAQQPTAASGCRDCRFFEQHDVPNQFLWQEDWNDRETLEARIESNGFRTLLGALRVLGRTHDLRLNNFEDATHRMETDS